MLLVKLFRRSRTSFLTQFQR